MVKILRLNLVFMLLYYLHLKLETKADFLIPSMNNMVEYDPKAYNDIIQKSPERYHQIAVDLQRPNSEEVVFPKLKRKKHKKKKNHNKKKNLPGNEITDEDIKKKVIKKNLKKKKTMASNEIIDENRNKKIKKKKTRRFIKTALKDEETSVESGEKNRRSPVDIIVHIKMND